jgi:hypothetical protein
MRKAIKRSPLRKSASQTPVDESADLSYNLGRSMSLPDSKENATSLNSETVLHLQHTIGNQKVQRLLAQRQPLSRQANPDALEEEQGHEAPVPLTTALDPALKASHPAVASLTRPDVRFRVPEFDRIKSAYLDKDLNIPEAVIKDRVGKLLERMQSENRLKSKDSIPNIIAKIFPSAGKIDEAAFEDAVDTGDRSKIYKDVFDAKTGVKSPDQAKLKKAIRDAIDLITKAEADSAGLTAVFGTKSATAKANYAKARAVLDTASKDMATHISTDYNLDDPEVGLGGWANFSSQHMHLLLDVVKVKDEDETKITLIHEASHLADSSVDDLGYYGSDGFEAMTEDEKVGNAAHYEELPKRELGVSSFAGLTFKPGVKKSGGVVTREDTVKRNASEYMRMAWDAAVDTHTFIRALRQQYLKGSRAGFVANEKIIMDLSKLMDLSVHEQTPSKAIITTLDVTLSESVARSVALIGSKVDAVPFPGPIGKETDDELRDKIVAQGVKDYGHLLKDPARDKKLLDWFHANYRAVPSV